MSTSNVAVTSFVRVLMRVSREKQWFAEHRYGSKLATQSAPSATAMSSTTSGAVSVAVSAPVRGSIREIVPVVGAATHSEPSPNTTTDGSGKFRPRRCTVRVTVFVARSICETVLSTSFVTHSEPAAIATPAGCLPTWIAFPTESVARRRRPPPGRPGTGSRSSRRMSSLRSSVVDRPIVPGRLQPPCNSAQPGPKLAGRWCRRAPHDSSFACSGRSRSGSTARSDRSREHGNARSSPSFSSTRTSPSRATDSIDELWSESPPPAAQASLRVAISKLRQLLGEEHRHVLETVPGGYRLALDEQQLDSARFEALLAAARSQPPAAAAALLDEALALWRGPPLADLAGYAFARTEADRLAELRLAIREERAVADLALGRHRELVPELAALVDESPYRERPRAQLMLALYRSGRQADALDVYRRGQRQLRDELGLEPGEELRRLEQAILTHDPAIAGPGAPAPRPARGARPARFSRRALALAIGAVVLGGTIAGVLLSRSPDHSAAAAVVPAHSLAVVAAGTDRIGRIRLGWTPTRVALSAHTLWMLDARDQTVVRLDLGDAEGRAHDRDRGHADGRRRGRRRRPGCSLPTRAR